MENAAVQAPEEVESVTYQTTAIWTSVEPNKVILWLTRKRTAFLRQPFLCSAFNLFNTLNMFNGIPPIFGAPGGFCIRSCGSARYGEDKTLRRVAEFNQQLSLFKPQPFELRPVPCVRPVTLAERGDAELETGFGSRP